MSEFNHKGHTEALQAHLLHGKAPEAHPSLREAHGTAGMPMRKGYPSTSEGHGTEYMPPADAGHKAP